MRDAGYAAQAPLQFFEESELGGGFGIRFLTERDRGGEHAAGTHA